MSFGAARSQRFAAALDADVDGAFGEQHVLPEVPEAACGPAALGEIEETGVEATQARVRQDGILDSRNL